VKYITPLHAGAQVFFSNWNRNGDKILFTSNKRDRRYFDTFIYDMLKDQEICIYSSSSAHIEIPTDWSKNERYVLLSKFYHNSDQDILLFDRDTNKLTNISEHSGSMKNRNGIFNRNSSVIYFLSDYEREFEGIAFYKIKTGEIGWFILENWDITDFKFSKNEKYLMYVINENGNSKIKLRNVTTKKTVTIKLPRGNCLQCEFTTDEKKIVLLLDNPQNPNDVFVYDIAKKKLEQLTFSMIGGIPKSDFTVPSCIKFNSFDKTEIYANLYIPKWIEKDCTYPAIIWPHGGPEWQEKNIFNKYFQILTNRGYIVIAPNFRGSTGYGKSFQKKIYKDWGGAEFKDVLNSYDYLLGTGYVDRKRIAVVGGSFGGFMTLTCITKEPELWRCAVDIFGPSNLFTFLGSIPEYWKPATFELVGDPERDKEMLYDRSPLNFVDNIQCPLLIVQGLNDIRVVKSESDQIVEKLKSRNKNVEYLVLEDEGHGFFKVINQIKVWSKITEFLDKNMN
jgi:dipeptidyl aminopeptidase/acylaminoacyl peptidase